MSSITKGLRFYPTGGNIGGIQAVEGPSLSTPSVMTHQVYLKKPGLPFISFRKSPCRNLAFKKGTRLGPGSRF